MADKKECDRCKKLAPFGTLKGWGTVAVRDFGVSEKDDQRPHTKRELCEPCKLAVIRFMNEPPPECAR